MLPINALMEYIEAYGPIYKIKFIGRETLALHFGFRLEGRCLEVLGPPDAFIIPGHVFISYISRMAAEGYANELWWTHGPKFFMAQSLARMLRQARLEQKTYDTF